VQGIVRGFCTASLWLLSLSVKHCSRLELCRRRYVSPDPVESIKGGLSACAMIRDVAQYIHNFVNRRCNGIKVAPPNEITVPGLRTYTHIQVTGQIITRTIMPQLADDPVSNASGKKRPAKDLSHVATELSHVATDL